jgi:hypothetical protein
MRRGEERRTRPARVRAERVLLKSRRRYGGEQTPPVPATQVWVVTMSQLNEAHWIDEVQAAPLARLALQVGLEGFVMVSQYPPMHSGNAEHD